MSTCEVLVVVEERETAEVVEGSLTMPRRLATLLVLLLPLLFSRTLQGGSAESDADESTRSDELLVQLLVMLNLILNFFLNPFITK